MPGWATQIFSREFDAALEKLPRNQRALIFERITEMGRRLDTFPHYRMTGREDYRLRVGDYRVIYRFKQDAVLLITLGHRREIYR